MSGAGAYPAGFGDMSPGYQDYYNQSWRGGSGPPRNPVAYAVSQQHGGQQFEPMNYAEWQALTGGNWGGGGGYPQPTPTPTPSPELLGLMQQAADPWGTYGQMGVNEPYLSNINTRFGWSPEGLAYGTQLQPTPTWYNPKTVYPDVILPKITGTASK